MEKVNYLIYLKNAAEPIPVEAVRIDFPDSKSKTLEIYISDTDTDPNIKILTSEVAGLVREPKGLVREPKKVLRGY